MNIALKMMKRLLELMRDDTWGMPVGLAAILSFFALVITAGVLPGYVEDHTPVFKGLNPSLKTLMILTFVAAGGLVASTVLMLLFKAIEDTNTLDR